MLRREALRSLLVLGVAGIAGCAPRGTVTLKPEAAAVGSVQTIFVATSRMLAPGATDFSGQPAAGLSFAELRVSVPPERVPGTVRFPRNGAPDPQTDFLTVSNKALSESAFLRAINAELAARRGDERVITLFVHGFNTTFSEGLYRQAQMRVDFETPGVSVQFSWPSAARGSAYATDREAVLVARDELEQVIGLLTRTNARRIVLAGHSMGAFLLMEALRQRAIRDGKAGFAKLEEVALIAPDIDVAVFRSQARELLDDDITIYVFTSNRDRALRLSAALRGNRERLGSVTDLAQIADLPVTVIDVSAVNSENDAMNHFAIATSPALFSLIQGMQRYGSAVLADADYSIPLLEASVMAVQDLTAVALQPLAQ
jgi:esterase/lipase superfamily enzyme